MYCTVKAKLAKLNWLNHKDERFDDLSEKAIKTTEENNSNNEELSLKINRYITIVFRIKNF